MRIPQLKTFATLTFSEFWLRMSYYGLQSLLVVYLVTQFHLGHKATFIIYGVYAAMGFGFGVIGGFIADKLIGQSLSLCLGSLLMFIGNSLLLEYNLSVNFIAISILILGLGLLKPANSCSLGITYQDSPQTQSKVFSYFYILANLGSILGPLIYGLDILFHHYAIGFTISALGTLCTFILFLMSGSRNQAHPKRIILAILLLILCGILIFLFLSNKIELGYFISILAIAVVTYLLNIYRKQETESKTNLKKLITPTLASIIAFAFILQIFSSITAFIQFHLKLQLLGLTIPASWIAMTQPIFVMIAAPILTLLWRYLGRIGLPVTKKNKPLIGLILCALGFFILSDAVSLHSMAATATLMIVANLFLALTEVAILPTAIHFTSKYSPQNIKGTMMGIFYFSLMLSGYLAGKIAGFAPSNVAHFSHYFFLLAVVILVLTLILSAINQTKS